MMRFFSMSSRPSRESCIPRTRTELFACHRSARGPRRPQASGLRLAAVASACLLLAWILAAIPAGAAGSVEAQLDRGRIALNGQALLTITLDGISGGNLRPEIPPVEGLEFHQSGRSSNISWVNGRLSSSTSFSYIVVGRREGTFRIGPIAVTDGGTRYQSEMLTLEVSAGAAGGGAPGSVPSAGALPGGGPAPRGSAEAGSVPAGSDGLFARVDIEPREAFVEQQVTMRFRLYQREDVQVIDIGEFVAPSAEGFWKEDLGAQRDYWVEMDGARYLVREMAWALFPTRAGDLEIGPASVTCVVPERSRRSRSPFGDFFDRGFFDRRTVPLTTAAKRVRVLPLPDDGRPSGFTGSVGDYSLDVRVDPPEAHQGEPFTLQATVRGAGHIQTIGAPQWPDWKGLRVYDSGEAVTSQASGDRIEGEKTFTQVLVPSRTGRVRLDSVRFSFFDPVGRRYRTIESGPIEISVGAGTASAMGAASDLTLGEDILYIESDLDRRLHPVSQGSSISPVHLVPLLLLGGAAYLRRRRLAALSNPVLARRSRAYREARAQLSALRAGPAAQADSRATAAQAAHALEHYLSAWLNLPVRGTRRSELREALTEAGVGSFADRITGMLDWSEEVRFGAGSSPGEALQRVTEMEGMLEELESAFRLVRGRNARKRQAVGSTALPLLLAAALAALCSVPAWGALPEGVSASLRQAERAYAESDYDEALEQYRHVLEQGWTSAGLYYNLGCSAFKAGEAGWAVAYFEEARRLDPRDPQIRHNLKIASARSRDRLPAAERSWLLDLFASLLDGYRPGDAVGALLALVWAGSLLIAGRWLLGGRLARLCGRALPVLAGLTALAVAGIALKAYQVRSGPSGVIVSNEVGVHAGPRGEETVQFALHAGTLLKVGRDAGDWREVWLSDEMRGWVPAETVTRLRPPRWAP
ncbi:MAG: BatD family protein [Candidatus Eisenbacteria bacterium]|nr:BatD family protein [Candidatus Eisenbacteria bacterium]